MKKRKVRKNLQDIKIDIPTPSLFVEEQCSSRNQTDLFQTPKTNARKRSRVEKVQNEPRNLETVEAKENTNLNEQKKETTNADKDSRKQKRKEGGQLVL